MLCKELVYCGLEPRNLLHVAGKQGMAETALPGSLWHSFRATGMLQGTTACLPYNCLHWAAWIL